jgi:predicted ABC-type sugar transport system permease subunit
MTEWLKALGAIKDPLLLVLAVVVLVVLWLSFRLLQTVIGATINALAEEVKGLSRDTTRLVICVDDMKRHQEVCNNRPRKAAHGDDA